MPQVLILNESISALDIYTEEKIIKNLLSIKKFVTNFIYAIINIGEIIMIENCSIKYIGSFKIFKSNFWSINEYIIMYSFLYQSVVFSRFRY